MKKIRIGLIGCGAVAEIGHLPAIMASPHCEMTALIDRNPMRLEVLAKRCGSVFLGDDYRDCIGKIDAAVLALPHHLHAPVTVDLLQHGIHTLVDKPMAMNAEECDAMIAAAEQSPGTVLAIGHMRRHLYTAKLAKSFIERGLLGKIQSFSIAEGGIYNWPVASDFFFKRRTSGGGVLIDTGAHTLDLMLWWLGEVKTFEYFDDQIDADGVEADCLILIVTTSGAGGTLELSRTRNLRNTAVISGELADMEVSLRNNYLAVYPKNSPVICKNNVAKKSNITDLSGHKALNMGAEIRLSKDTLVGKHSIECIAEAGGSSGHIYGTRDTAIMMPAEPLTEYTVHVYLKGISGDFSEVPLLFRVGNGDFKFIKNSVVYLTDQWKRYSLTFTSGAQDDSISLGVWKRSDPTPIRWLADGFQLEKGPASGYYGPPRAPIIFDSMGPPGPQAFTSLFHDQIADFIDAINGVRAPIASGADGKLVVETIERLYEGREHMVSDWDRSNVVNVGKSK